ncbi:MAG: hypothetical protein U9R51_10115, partial [Actinomycetota bacterium]|nr:hypothetical protein [Actinomycetota bacterium]
SPLEIFRAALEMLAPTLTDSGVPPVATGLSMTEGDPYDLAPGSSSALGPEAHDAHLAWGAAKASAFLAERSDTPSEPAILLMAADRGERDALVPLLNTPGMRCMAARNPAAVARAIEQWAVVSAFVDFSHRSAGDAITRLVEANVPTIVYGDDVDDLVETGLRAQGVRNVVGRGVFIADPAGFLPRLA